MNLATVIAFCLLSTVFILMGCKTYQKPTVVRTLDVYMEDTGFIVISEKGKDEGIAIRFNVAEIYTKGE